MTVTSPHLSRLYIGVGRLGTGCNVSSTFFIILGLPLTCKDGKLRQEKKKEIKNYFKEAETSGGWRFGFILLGQGNTCNRFPGVHVYCQFNKQESTVCHET